MIAVGLISATTAIGVSIRRRKNLNSDISQSVSSSTITDSEVDVSSELDVPPPPPPLDFSPDMPPPTHHEKNTARQQREQFEDKIAEAHRKKQQLSFPQEWKNLIAARPKFMSKHDLNIDPKTIPIVGKFEDVRVMMEPDGSVIRLIASDWEEAVAMAKDQSLVTNLPKDVLNNLSKSELEAYTKWKNKADSYIRRRNDWLSRNPGGGLIAGTRG